MKTYLKPIANLKACQEALDWAEQYDNLNKAWQKCQRGDWMLWLIGKAIAKDADRKPLVLIACKCARLALPYVLKGEEQPQKAIETAEAWVIGKATLKEVKAAAAYAAYAANAASYVANAASAANAAYAASYAANAASAAYAASYAAYAAADAASASYAAYASDAAYAAAYASYAAADESTLSQCADLVRAYYPNPPLIKVRRS